LATCAFAGDRRCFLSLKNLFTMSKEKRSKLRPLTYRGIIGRAPGLIATYAYFSKDLEAESFLLDATHKAWWYRQEWIYEPEIRGRLSLEDLVAISTESVVSALSFTGMSASRRFLSQRVEKYRDTKPWVSLQAQEFLVRADRVVKYGLLKVFEFEREQYRNGCKSQSSTPKER